MQLTATSPKFGKVEIKDIDLKAKTATMVIKGREFKSTFKTCNHISLTQEVCDAFELPSSFASLVLKLDFNTVTLNSLMQSGKIQTEIVNQKDVYAAQANIKAHRAAMATLPDNRVYGDRVLDGSYREN